MPQRKFVFWEVDVQADFMLPGGNLYVPGAEKIIPNIQRLVEAASDAHIFIVSSADAHSEHDPEFESLPAALHSRHGGCANRARRHGAKVSV